MQFLGTISYTVYLVHVLAAWIINQVMLHAFGIATFTWTTAALAAALAIGMARASWHYIEKPALSWKDRRFPSQPHPPEPTLS